MGPWTIRDRRQPFRPGCSYDVLVSMAKAGRIKGTTILRGPTTRQFWTLARNAPGVAHLVGYCHQCGHHVEGTEDACPKCQTPFRAVKVRDHLGLMFPHNADARRAQQELELQRRGMSQDEARRELITGGDTPSSQDSQKSGVDLLDQVLDLSELDNLPGSTDSSQGETASAESLDFAPDASDVELLESDDMPSFQPDLTTPTHASADERAAAKRGFGTRPAAAPAAVFDVAPTSEIPRQPLHWGVWVLAALNVIAITAFALYLLM